jgi:CheY-like chemotaxis protein
VGAQKVLVVEDDSDLRRMFRNVLQLQGYDVVEAGNGLDALRQLDTRVIDCVVLDLGLPMIDGHAVLQEVAGRSATRAVPVVVVVTGLPGPHDELPHASCVLKKPVTPERLLTTIRQCMASSSSAERA